MTDSKTESADLWTRIEGYAERCRTALKISPGTRLNTWDQTILDLSEAMLQLKTKTENQGKLLARQMVEKNSDD